MPNCLGAKKGNYGFEPIPQHPGPYGQKGDHQPDQRFGNNPLQKKAPALRKRMLSLNFATG
ncbi:MAG: hypothetical protein EA366_10455 [Spirulina sp. DLM2.Bin59]|nr:MAG: hypothetical protein EA366_10455 [Spirulina sp. DLM2.Bin59]